MTIFRFEKTKQQYSPEFMEFWNAYPRKIGKMAAYKIWSRKKPLIQDVLDALEWQKKSAQWTKDGGEFVPHPSTYLNQHRWEDEQQIEAPKGNTPSWY